MINVIGEDREVGLSEEASTTVVLTAYRIWFWGTRYPAIAFLTWKAWCKIIFIWLLVKSNYFQTTFFFRGRKQRLWTHFWGATHWYHLSRRVLRWASFNELQSSSNSFSYLQVTSLVLVFRFYIFHSVSVSNGGFKWLPVITGRYVVFKAGKKWGDVPLPRKDHPWFMLPKQPGTVENNKLHFCFRVFSFWKEYRSRCKTTAKKVTFKISLSSYLSNLG